MKISIIVLVYDVGQNLNKFLSKLLSVLEGHRETRDYELILVDVGHENQELSVIETLARNNPFIKLIPKKDLSGFGNAMKFGFKEARGEVIITIMGDLSNSPEDIPKLVRKIEEGYDIAYGSRFMKGGSLQGYTGSKKTIANRSINYFIQLAFGIPNKDVTNIFKAYKRAVLEAVGIDNIESNGFDFSMEVPLKAHILGFKSIEVPISWNCLEWEKDINISLISYIYGKRLLKLFFWGNLVSLKDLFGLVIKGSFFGTLMTFLLGIVIITFIFSVSGFSNVFKILGSVSLPWFTLCCVSILMSFLLRTWRWNIILKSAGYTFPKGILFKCIMFGWFFNYLIPARVGDVARGVALQTSEGAPLGMTLSTIVVERIFDMITLVLFLAIPSIFFFKAQFLWLEMLSLGITLTLIISLGIVYKCDERSAKWLLASRLSTVGRSLILLKQGLQGIISNKTALILCLGISMPIWFFELFSIFLAARGLDFHLPLFQAAISGVASFVAQTVPLTPAGLGVHEASITGMLGIFGVKAQIALSIALIDHFARGSIIYVLGFMSVIHIGFASRWYYRRALEENEHI